MILPVLLIVLIVLLVVGGIRPPQAAQGVGQASDRTGTLVAPVMAARRRAQLP